MQFMASLSEPSWSLWVTEPRVLRRSIYQLTDVKRWPQPATTVRHTFACKQSWRRPQTFAKKSLEKSKVEKFMLETYYQHLSCQRGSLSKQKRTQRNKRICKSQWIWTACFTTNLWLKSALHTDWDQLRPNHTPSRIDSSASTLGRRPAITSQQVWIHVPPFPALSCLVDIQNVLNALTLIHTWEI